MTADVILRSQNGDKDATLFLVEKFNPLLKKYSFKLFYEDSYNDLLTDFLELIHNIQISALHCKDEGSVVNYISASIHNSYLKRLRQIHEFRKFRSFSELNDTELYYIEVTCSTNDTYQECDSGSIGRVLSNSEQSLINMIYYLGYTPTEISKVIGVSRQAVNQMKNRALRKLRILYSDKL